MSAEDYLPLGWEDDYRVWLGFRKPGQSVVTCERCGTRGLKWKELPHGWRLFSGKAQHNCYSATSPEAEFGDVE